VVSSQRLVTPPVPNAVRPFNNNRKTSLSDTPLTLKSLAGKNVFRRLIVRCVSRKTCIETKVEVVVIVHPS
jgi:hypothetical protein